MGTGSSSEKIKVEGVCEKQYEPVKEHLLEMLTKGKEENVQLCVYVNGNCVVDLYGTAVGDNNYNHDKLQTIFSSGKSLEAIAMATLFDKGLFQYEDTIAKYWPEFAQNGKENVKICDVLRHESGLAYFKDKSPTLDECTTANIKLNKVGEIIEKEELHWPEYDKSDSKREYHAMVRGLVLNEVIRRIDPQGRTISEIFRQDISIDGILLGLQENEIEKCVPVVAMSSGFMIKQMFTPSWAGRRISQSTGEIIKMMKFYAGAMKDLQSHKNNVEADNIKTLDGFPALASSAPWRKAEFPSANFQANARGCAKLASIMSLKGDSLMSEKTWDEMHSEPTTAEILKLHGGNCRSNFTKGGVNLHFIPENNATDSEIALNKDREGYYGWMGYGGSVVQWHPELKIGFAFIPTLMSGVEMVNERGAVLQKIVKDCCSISTN